MITYGLKDETTKGRIELFFPLRVTGRGGRKNMTGEQKTSLDESTTRFIGRKERRRRNLNLPWNITANERGLVCSSETISPGWG
jgi:hypothetical protein